MNSSLHRGQRLLALALAATTVGVAALTTAASAQAATTTDNYTGSADSAALQLVITLPSALAGPLGAALPNPIDLSLIRSTGSASHDGKTADVASSIAQLAQGSLLTSNAVGTALSGALNKSVASTLALPNPASVSVASLPPNPPLNLNLTAGPLAAASNPTTKSTQSSGAVGAGSLGSLSALAPQLTVPLQAGLTQLTTALTTATTALSNGITASAAGASALDPVVAAANGALGAIPIPSTGIAGIPTSIPAIPLPSATTAGLATTINQLPTLLDSVFAQLLNGAVLNLGALSATEGITPVAAGTTSTGATNTGDIALLGGLVNVVASKASATATATGAPSKSTANATATLVQVTVSTALTNLLDVTASDKGITTSLLTQLGLGGATNDAVSALVQPVSDAIDAIEAQVMSLLQMLNSGVKVLQQGTTSTSKSTDGTHAEAHATPAQVVVGLPGAANLVALSLGKVDVVANQQNFTPAAVTVVAPKKPVVIKTPKKVVAPTQRLAYTGADLPLTAGAALAMLAAGGVLSRRRRRPATDV